MEWRAFKHTNIQHKMCKPKLHINKNIFWVSNIISKDTTLKKTQKTNKIILYFFHNKTQKE